MMEQTCPESRWPRVQQSFYMAIGDRRYDEPSMMIRNPDGSKDVSTGNPEEQSSSLLCWDD